MKRLLDHVAALKATAALIEVMTSPEDSSQQRGKQCGKFQCLLENNRATIHVFWYADACRLKYGRRDIIGGIPV